MIGEDGGIQWGALLSYNFALSLLIVTTNVVVLCQYLPQEFPLWGTIKGYCIALHCIALHCIALHCIALHCIALHCIALHCIALHCIALHCIALHCIAQHMVHNCRRKQDTSQETADEYVAFSCFHIKHADVRAIMDFIYPCMCILKFQ